MTKPVLNTSPRAEVHTHDTEQLDRLRSLTRLLDNAVQVPGTSYRFGLDAVIGLIPGIGDAVGGLLSSFIVVQAARMGAPRSTLVRMIGNVVLDTLVGGIPLLGDLFDFGYKANTRNLKLLEKHLDQPVSARRSSRRVVLLTGVGLLVVLAAMVALIIGLFGLIFDLAQ